MQAGGFGARAADAAMERYAAGDDKAFGEVYDAVAPRLYRFIRRSLRSDARAEELMQQTLLQMHRARGRFILGAEVMPWAFAIARRLTIDESRRVRRDSIARASELSGDEAECASMAADARLELLELGGRLDVVLRRLPESQRTAFELVRIDGLSHGEAAEALGVTVSAVKLRVHRAYEALRTAFDGGAKRGTSP